MTDQTSETPTVPAAVERAICEMVAKDRKWNEESYGQRTLSDEERQRLDDSDRREREWLRGYWASFSSRAEMEDRLREVLSELEAYEESCSDGECVSGGKLRRYSTQIEALDCFLNIDEREIE